MGKSVTVLPGFSFVQGPGPQGSKSYKTGATIVYTDAEYAALPLSVTRCLSTPATTVPDPSRPSTDTASRSVTVNNAATGTVALVLGPNKLTLTGNVTLTFPTGVASGNQSSIDLILIQDGTGSRTLTLPASAKNPAGAATVLSLGAGKVDFLRYITLDGGTTWLQVDRVLDLR